MSGEKGGVNLTVKSVCRGGTEGEASRQRRQQMHGPKKRKNGRRSTEQTAETAGVQTAETSSPTRKKKKETPSAPSVFICPLVLPSSRDLAASPSPRVFILPSVSRRFLNHNLNQMRFTQAEAMTMIILRFCCHPGKERICLLETFDGFQVELIWKLCEVAENPSTSGSFNHVR